MKRLKPIQKERILLAARDAVFQQLADAEEQIEDEANEEALRTLEIQNIDPTDNDDVWDTVQRKVQDEIKKTIARMFEATKKGQAD